MINFNQIDFSINGSGVLATSVSLSSEGSIQPVSSLGFKSANLTPNGSIKNSLRASYIPNSAGEPNFIISQLLKGGTSVGPQVINVGGVTGLYYLSSFSIRALPNQPLESSVNYIGFDEINREISVSNSNIYQKTRDDFFHGVTTLVSSEGSIVNFPTYELNYDIRFNWIPTYVCGRKYPSQVDLQDGVETISLVRDKFFSGNFYGENAFDKLFGASGRSIILNNLSTKWNGGQLEFYINASGAKISNSEITISAGDTVKVQTTCIRGF